MQVEQARHQKSRHLFLAVLGATTLGCGGGHLSISDPPGPPVYQENEPNDFLYFPDWMGGLDDHDHLIIEGHVDGFGPDIADHFEFFAEEPLEVEFWLDGWQPGADVDICLIDPDTGELLASYDSPDNFESGYFSIDWPGKHFVLRVESWIFGTSYSLEIVTGHHFATSGGQDGPASASLDSTSGISFPFGKPSPGKSEDRRGDEPRDAGPTDEELRRRALLES